MGFIINPYRYATWASNWLLNNLIFCYEMESDATDETGTYDGTATNVTWDTTTYKLGTASAQFNGSSSKIEENTYAGDSANDFSYSIWVYFDVVNTTQEVFISGSANRFGLRMKDGNYGSTDGKISARANINWSWTVLHQTGISATTRNHFVFTSKSGEQVLYHNWSSAASATNSQSGSYTYTWFQLSAYYTDTSIWFAWNIDQTCFRSVALTSDQVSDLYNSWSGLSYSSFTS